MSVPLRTTENSEAAGKNGSRTSPAQGNWHGHLDCHCQDTQIKPMGTCGAVVAA